MASENKIRSEVGNPDLIINVQERSSWGRKALLSSLRGIIVGIGISAAGYAAFYLAAITRRRIPVDGMGPASIRYLSMALVFIIWCGSVGFFSNRLPGERRLWKRALWILVSFLISGSIPLLAILLFGKTGDWRVAGLIFGIGGGFISGVVTFAPWEQAPQ